MCMCVLDWSEQDVIEKYLKPIGMDYLAKVFTENKITGHVLMSLEASLTLQRERGREGVGERE